MSQSAKILTHLRRRPLTSMQAIQKWGCTRLAARIADLRAQGYKITTETVTKDGKSWARYRLESA